MKWTSLLFVCTLVFTLSLTQNTYAADEDRPTIIDTR